jgi:hypothetical protein
MITNKGDEDAKREEQEDPKREAQKNAFINGQSPESVKKNPNPRANENLPEKEQKNDEDTTGAGSEITDGEDG